MDQDRDTEVQSELNIALTLFSYCRQMLRYNGVDPVRTQIAYSGIENTVHEWIKFLEDQE